MSRLKLQQRFRRRPLALLLSAILLPFRVAAGEGNLAGEQPCPVDSENRTIVQQGDHLILLAIRCFGKESLWRQLAELNSLSSPYFISRGSRLRLPEGIPQIDAATSLRLERQYWRSMLDSRETPAAASVNSAPAAPSVSEARADSELAAISAADSPNPAKALAATQALLNERPELVSARITEIRLLAEAGRREEAAARARSLLADHPELGVIRKLGEWSATSPQEGSP